MTTSTRCARSGKPIATLLQRLDRLAGISGNVLTVHGVTRPTTWRVDARFHGDTVRGSASTGFTFAEFGLPQARVPVVLSVSDTIKLEYDFTLVPKR